MRERSPVAAPASALPLRRQSNPPGLATSTEPNLVLSAPGRSSKPVPKMPPRTKRKSQPVRSQRLTALGAVLVVGLTIIAFAGGRFFGGSDDGDRSDADRSVVGSAFPTPGTPPPVPTEAIPPTAPALIAFDGRAPRVCLDPGHGGDDFGFTRTPLDLLYLQEKDLVLQHAWDLEYRLQEFGFQVMMTRDSDTAVNTSDRDVNGDGKTARDDAPGTYTYRNFDELQARVDVCNTAGADLLVSMHVNGFSTAVPQGYETWYTPGRPFSEQSEEFACLAYTALKEQLTEIGYAIAITDERGCNPDTAINVDDNRREQVENFIVTGPAVRGKVPRPSEMPGAIIEALFLSNDQDANVLASPGGRNAIVTAYQQAIVQYFRENPPEDRPSPVAAAATPAAATPAEAGE